MRYRIELLLLGVMLLSLVGVSSAEVLTVTVNEPSVPTNDLAHSEVWWCLGTNCLDFRKGPRVPASDPGGSGAPVATITVPFVSGETTTVRVRARAVNTAGNRGAWSAIITCTGSC